MSTSKRSIETKDSVKSPKRTKLDAGQANVKSNLPFSPDGFNCARARLMTAQSESESGRDISGKCVIYWMSRDQRAADNNAMHYAQSVAQTAGLPLKVVFNLVPKFLEATIRQYGFMVKGLQEVERDLRSRDIPMHLLTGDPVMNIPAFAKEHEALLVVADFSPLRVGLGWVKSVAAALDADVSTNSSSSSSASASGTAHGHAHGQAAYKYKIPLVQVDAHNIVPCWVASPKLEYAARTIRSKISALLPQYLTPIPALQANPAGSLEGCAAIDWAAALAGLEINRAVPEVKWIASGPSAAWEMLEGFIGEKDP